MEKKKYPKKLYPIEWDAGVNHKANGWKNNPKVLAKIVTAINEEMYVEDENEMMEYIDHAIEYIKNEYFSGPKIV